MSTFFVTNTRGETAEIEIRPDWSLMEVLREEGYDEILAMCGGSCSCATCHVHLEGANGLAPSGLAPIEEDEEMLVMTTESYDAAKSRLSCQIPLNSQLAGLRVTLVGDEA